MTSQGQISILFLMMVHSLCMCTFIVIRATVATAITRVTAAENETAGLATTSARK